MKSFLFAAPFACSLTVVAACGEEKSPVVDEAFDAPLFPAGTQQFDRQIHLERVRLWDR